VAANLLEKKENLKPGKFRAGESSGFVSVPLVLPLLRNNRAALKATRVWSGVTA
jgi:hypothetical protein